MDASAPASVRPPPVRPASDPALWGTLYALSALLLWGLSPIYFKAVGTVPPLEVLAHRIAWAVLLVGAVLLTLMRPRDLWLRLGGARRIGLYGVTALLISVNWLVFIWAVGHDQVVQISLGYYINPLVNVALGVVFLGERLNRRQLAAVALAALGVSSLVAQHGTLPWVSLTLATSFGVYALMRKKFHMDPLAGFLAETAVLLPVALVYLIGLGLQGDGAFGRDWEISVLLALAGPVTAAPLILFMYGAQRLKLSTIGLMQYLAPTCHLLLAVFLYGEPFTGAHGVAFACIWVALALYSADAMRSRRQDRAAARATSASPAGAEAQDGERGA